DVLGRDVAVDDVQVHPAPVLLAVRVVQALADLGRDVRRLGDGHARVPGAEAVQDGAEVRAGDVLHGDVEGVVVLPQLVDVHDVGVVQLHADPRLVDEHGD